MLAGHCLRQSRTASSSSDERGSCVSLIRSCAFARSSIRIEEEPVLVHLEGVIHIDDEVILVEPESMAKSNSEESDNQEHTHCRPHFVFHVTGDILTAKYARFFFLIYLCARL